MTTAQTNTDFAVNRTLAIRTRDLTAALASFTNAVQSFTDDPEQPRPSVGLVMAEIGVFAEALNAFVDHYQPDYPELFGVRRLTVSLERGEGLPPITSETHNDK